MEVSRKKITEKLSSFGLNGKQLKDAVDYELKKEIAAGCQTIQYQVNTLMTTNGQSPFVTLFMELYEDVENGETIADEAMIYEEILSQRLQGIKNENGVYITPPFPKLIYVLDECNCLNGGDYDYLTELAIKCTAKRMYPDYISAKRCERTMMVTYFPVWDVARSSHHGRMRMANISGKDVLTRVLLV